MITLARIAAIISLFPTLIFACLWDSDTIRDEIQARPSLFELVAGHLPHHGTAYYEARVGRLEPKRDRSREETNDLAVALIRLSRFDEAAALLKAQLAKEPGRYITLSNLGVLHKKQGDYARAADYIHQALAIKPEGHMGLGDWYEKALAWRAQRESETSPPLENFLGGNYDKQKPSIKGNWPLTGEREEKFDKLQNLLRNDQGFADGFLVMGDFLVTSGDLHLGMICYYRSLQLNHPNPAMVKRRIDNVRDHWREASLGFKQWTSQDKVGEMINEAESWLEMFQKTEAKLLGLGEEPDFKAVLAAMPNMEAAPSVLKSWAYFLAIVIVAGALSVFGFVVIKPRLTAKS